MRDIISLTNSLRQAVATASLKVSRIETIEAVKAKKVAIGDVFEFSRAAGLLAIKKTSDVIPDCHPLPIEAARITHSFDGLTIRVEVEVQTIYKTGVGIEAMHGAFVTALTMYEMLKPLDPLMEITSVMLVSQKDSKTDVRYKEDYSQLKVALLICSDSILAGKGEDVTGLLMIEKLKEFGIPTQVYEIVRDNIEFIRQKTLELEADGTDLLLYCGGTGLSPQDCTPDAIQSLLTQEIPGIMEAVRSYGQQRTPLAMLSRGIAGFINNMLVITFPGSPKGANESFDAVFPHVLHLHYVKKGWMQH